MHRMEQETDAVVIYISMPSILTHLSLFSSFWRGNNIDDIQIINPAYDYCYIADNEISNIHNMKYFSTDLDCLYLYTDTFSHIYNECSI